MNSPSVLPKKKKESTSDKRDKNPRSAFNANSLTFQTYTDDLTKIAWSGVTMR